MTSEVIRNLPYYEAKIKKVRAQRWTAIALLVAIIALGWAKINLNQKFAIDQYKHNNCEMISDLHTVWYECPTQ